MFCRYCGRTLLKGEKCSCSGAVKASGDYAYRNNHDYDSGYSDNFSDSFGNFNTENSNYNNGYDQNPNGFSSNYNNSYGQNSNGFNNNYNNGYGQNSNGFSDNYNNTGTNGYNAMPNNGSTYNASSRTSTPVLIISVIVIVLIVSIIIGFVSSMILNEQSDIDYGYTPEPVWDDDYNYKDDDYSSSASTDYTTGILSDDTYKNEWADLTIPLPARYEAVEDDVLAEYSSDLDDCVLIAYKGSTGVLCVYTCDKDWANEYNTETLLGFYTDSYIESLLDGGWEVSEISNYEFETVTIGNNKYLMTNIEVEDYGNIAFLLHRVNGGYVYIKVDDISRSRTDKIINSFEGYSK